MPALAPSTLPDWLPTSLADVVRHLTTPSALATLVLLSAFLVVASLFGVTWAVRRLPPDYLVSEGERAPRTGVALVTLVLRNAVGVVLLVLGALMLVLPGQGLLTLLVGLTLVDFPGKRALERRLIAKPRVLAAINALRRRSGRPELRTRRDAG